MNNVTDFILKTWMSTRKTKQTPKGWQSGNAPCCPHNGESRDTRGRGGTKIDSSTGGIVYSCFNCGFKTGYTPGKKLYHKTRKLLSWMGASERDISRMVIEAMRVRDTSLFVEVEEKVHDEIDFKERELPAGALSFEQWAEFYILKGSNVYPGGLLTAVQYASSRMGDISNMDLYWTEDNEMAMNKRLIIPFTWKGKIVGYTARSLKKLIRPKYLNNVDSNYVFGTDNLVKESDFVLVFEGPIDAILMNGVAVLSNIVSVEQADLIEDLGKKVIVVPDMESTGTRLIDSAIEFGWHVSFPEWEDDVKDAGEAVQRYGKLFTLKTIISNILSSKLKIELYKKRMTK